MATAIAAAPTATPQGWLRSQSFDLGFIYGVALLALVSGLVAFAVPALFLPILILDLWLLGYHHVVATWTRLCFDKQSMSEHRALLTWLPLAVVLAVVALFFVVGPWSLATIYFYWQWFHYTRQSWGISQAYRRKAGDRALATPKLDQAAMYLLPLWGILHRSAEQPAAFLGMELWTLALPWPVVHLVGVGALVAVGLWLVTRIQAWRAGSLPYAHTAYVLTHLLIFFVGYVALPHIDPGWLVLNVWHNAQYILFVWVFNTSRFKNGPVPEARFLSTISQGDRAWRYFGTCLAISTLIYGLIKLVVPLSVVVVVYQTINFHHYIVDSLIWKLRKKPIQTTLDLERQATPSS